MKKDCMKQCFEILSQPGSKLSESNGLSTMPKYKREIKQAIKCFSLMQKHSKI